MEACIQTASGNGTVRFASDPVFGGMGENVLARWRAGGIRTPLIDRYRLKYILNLCWLRWRKAM